MNLLRASDLRIRRRVQSFLKRRQTLPVDVFGIAKGQGADVRRVDLAPDVAGILYREPDRTVMVVNATLSDVRQRLSIARQLGHMVLHSRTTVTVDYGLRVDVRSPASATVDQIEEVEANLFALYLLCPTDRVTGLFKDRVVDFSDQAALENKAEKFGVTSSLLILRLLILTD